MHPALQPTRTQRIATRATDLAGAAFWIAMLAIIVGGTIAAAVL